MTFETKLTAFMLIKTTPKWLSLAVPERMRAFETEILPKLKDIEGVRSRYYDTEFYGAKVTDVWMWEARDHESYQLLVEALRETPFWDTYFEVVELLVGVENGYALNYGVDPLATVGD
ncbi:darcynin [Lentzea aerocolonigenes]|uniref:Darcynin n=1 Tax=Lentzea aerocolonigenes TaxID=68170 RepID=A0A0F0GMG7_LENAE|nr:darcynin family protein [Lentzea aerocolonigenes]KJK42608.1 darcynin [Lentzea aerocolonigenes]